MFYLSLFTFSLIVLGQNVIENVGFGQATDSAKEGESEIIRIRLEPDGISETVTGQIIPLSLSQYMNYTFITERTVPQSVIDAITAIEDPAECKDIVIMLLHKLIIIMVHR